MPETPCEQAAIRLQHVHAGAVALRELLSDVLLASEAQLAAARAADPDREDDSRDYRALSALVQHGLEAGLRHPDAGHREGFCRTLTDLLVMVVDGVLPGERWDPIANTARSFELRAPAPAVERAVAEPVCATRAGAADTPPDLKTAVLYLLRQQQTFNACAQVFEDLEDPLIAVDLDVQWRATALRCCVEAARREATVALKALEAPGHLTMAEQNGNG